MTDIHRRDACSRALRALFALVILAMVAACFIGCTSAELDRVNPPIQQSPCNEQNDFWCGDGAGCCYDALPICKVDDSGPYCAVDESTDVQDNTVPGDMSSAKPKRGARVPVSK